MTFANLSFQYIAVFLVLLIWSSWLVFYYYKKNKELHHKYKLLWHIFRFKFFSVICLFSSLLFLFVSLLGPRWVGTTQNNQNDWIDIVFTLDVSQSMDTKDVDPSRLETSKNFIQNFVKNHPDDRASLVVFAWDATSICPLTFDHDIFLTFLDGVNWKNITNQWTDLLAALELSVKRLWTWSDRSKLIVMLSDGWDESIQYDFSTLKEAMQKNNIHLITIWVWTEDGWYIPTGQDPFWQMYYKKYQGKEVRSVLNEDNLQKLAKELDASYAPMYDADSLASVEQLTNWLQKKILDAWVMTERKDLSRLLSIASLLCFCVFILSLFYSRNYK